MAHVGLAQAYVAMAHRTDVAPAAFARRARDAAVRARELDPELVEGRVALAGVMGFLEWDWKGAERELRRALDLNPSDPTARRHGARTRCPSRSGRRSRRRSSAPSWPGSRRIPDDRAPRPCSGHLVVSHGTTTT
jgi:hypothetical protein